MPDNQQLTVAFFNGRRDIAGEYYEKANLKHALNAVAGLFVLVLYLYREKACRGQLSPRPQLLRDDQRHHGGEILAAHDAGFVYDIGARRHTSA